MKKFIYISLLSACGITMAHADLVIQPSSTNNNTTAYMSTTVASPPSDASLERLMQVFHVTEMIDTAIEEQNKIANVMQTIPNTVPDAQKGIFARKKQQKLQAIMSKYGKVFGAEMNNPNRRQQMMDAYKLAAKKNYTQADVDALIGFYQTPTGQQLLQKQNQVTLDYMQAVLPATVGKSAENLEQIFPMLEKDIKKIFE